jgi:AcrR family transcriptional regulator
VATTKTYHHPDLRAALIAEGLSQIERVGMDLSLRALAKSIGVSPTAPYRHFSDRNELMGALAAEGFHHFTDALSVANTEPIPMVALKKLGVAYLDFARKQPLLYRLMFSPYGYSLNSDSCKEAADRAFDSLIGCVARANEAGWKRGHAVLTLSLSFWAELHGWACLSSDRLLPPDVVEASWEDLLDAYLS